jgi:hypothetical protein
MRTNVFLFSLLLFPFIALSAPQTQDPTMTGQWVMLRDQSTDIDHLRALSLELRQDGDRITLLRTWGGGRHQVHDSISVRPGGAPVVVPVRAWVFPSNIFMGVSMQEGDSRRITARKEDGGRVLVFDEQVNLQTSQGKKPATMSHHFQLENGGELLVYTLTRSSRTTGPEVIYRLKRMGTREGFVFRLDDNWEIGGKLPQNAMMISLQGLANRTGPNLYLLYPDDWPFTYVNSAFDFYKTKRFYTFRELRTPAEALRALAKFAKGYVVWDAAVRPSLIVAYTVAGLEDAVVVNEELIPLVQRAGLNPVEDLRGKFTGMTPAQIYSWAYDRYWARCSKEFIVWLGGDAGPIMKPAVADWGIHTRVFFNDLSTRRTDTAEYALASRLLSEMKPMSMVMGWHSYAKDLEEEHVALTSSYGHRVEGLNSLPNLTFSAQVPATPGYTYKNNHHVKPGEKITPQKKVYISCIQTDGIGLGAWLKPGRGEIPYAWEVLMNYTWMAPGMIEYFYSMATPNDYFIGCLSGPGYLYPKAVPPRFLPPLIAMAREQMKTLDLRVFETMDWSQGDEISGNTDLTASILDQYFQGMPEAIGFVNGYGPGHTFTTHNGRAMVSYDYYLSPYRPEADAVADLQELALLNPKRPYFLLVHVREYSDVKRVKGILDKLGPDYEVVPLDVFLTMAGQEPTFQERTLQK